MSRLSDDKKHKAESGAVHRSIIYLTTEENPGNSQLGYDLKTTPTSHRLRWGPLLPNAIGRVALNVIDKEGRKEMGRCINAYCFELLLQDAALVRSPGGGGIFSQCMGSEVRFYFIKYISCFDHSTRLTAYYTSYSLYL